MAEKKEIHKDKRLLKYAFIAGILTVVFSAIQVILTKVIVSSLLNNILGIIIMLLSATFFYGFFILGKMHNKKFMKVISLLMIIFNIVSFFVLSFYLIGLTEKIGNITSQTASQLNIDLKTITLEQQQLLGQILGQDKSFVSSLKSVLVISVALVVLFVIIGILFGVSLLTLKEIKYSKIAGILVLIGSVIAPLFFFGLGLVNSSANAAIGVLLLFIGFFGVLAITVSYVFGLVILYRESKK